MFFSGRVWAISSAQEGKLGSIYMVKLISCLSCQYNKIGLLLSLEVTSTESLDPDQTAPFPLIWVHTVLPLY